MIQSGYKARRPNDCPRSPQHPEHHRAPALPAAQTALALEPALERLALRPLAGAPRHDRSPAAARARNRHLRRLCLGRRHPVLDGPGGHPLGWRAYLRGPDYQNLPGAQPAHLRPFARLRPLRRLFLLARLRQPARGAWGAHDLPPSLLSRKDDPYHYREHHPLLQHRQFTPQPAGYEATYGPTTREASETARNTAPPASGRTCLASFLTERYCLFTPFAGRMLIGHIHHQPWPLEPAEAEIRLNQIPRAHGITLPDTPPVLHFARQLRVLLWSLLPDVPCDSSYG